MPEFELVDDEEVFEGGRFSVRRGRFRHADGEEVTRERVQTPGAVAIVAQDGERVFLVRQPREAIGRSDVLEIPAGMLDAEGETPLETAKRELLEELGMEADEWAPATTYFSSSGFTDEEVHVFLASGLRPVAEPDASGEERIEVVTWPLARLDDLIDEVADAKTLVGLLWLRRQRGG